MPVVSPSRYTTTSSSLSGSYRSTLTSSTSLDKPYYRTSSGTYVTSSIRNNFGDRTTEYRSRYSDVDGKRERKTSLVEYTRASRAPSVTDSDSGISSRYRSERSESRGRDISTTRSESSKTVSEPLTRNKRSSLSSAALAMSTAELYNKYSPSNYVPLTQRIQQAAAANNHGEISRSKSISNDIGRPPAADPSRIGRKTRNSTAATITEVSIILCNKYLLDAILESYHSNKILYYIALYIGPYKQYKTSSFITCTFYIHTNVLSISSSTSFIVSSLKSKNELVKNVSIVCYSCVFCLIYLPSYIPFQSCIQKAVFSKV